MADKIFRPSDGVANPSAREGDDDGTLGCFAQTADGTVVLLSCAHVLFANGTSRKNLAIYSPPPSSTCCRHTHIADTLNTWTEGFGPQVTIVSDPDEHGDILDPQVGFETDCAIAKLRPNILYSNEIPGIGMIAGTPASGLGVVAQPPLGTAPTPDQLVRFYSLNTKRVHYGTVLPPLAPGAFQGGARLDPLRWPDASGAGVKDSESKPLVGGLVIMPRPAPGESLDPYLNGSRKLRFGQEGDSGAVVMNSRNEVIGVMCRAGGSKPDRPEFMSHPEWRAVTSHGVLSPIGRVLERMQITIPPNLAKIKHSAGASLAADVPADPDEIALRRGQQRLADQLRRSRLGRVILEKLARHRVEARRIVQRDRHAMAIWRRCEGPSFVNHCIHNLRDPAHRIPLVINGVARGELLRAMADVLAAQGSPALRRDIERYREIALAYAPGLMGLDEVPSAITALQADWLGQVDGAPP